MKENSGEGLKQRYYSCYSASVLRILNAMGYSFSEVDLFKSIGLLQLNCSTQYDGVYSEIEQIVNWSLKQNGIEINELSIRSKDTLLEELSKRKMLLLKINARKLNYSKLFTTAITNHRYHYVIVNGFDEEKIGIVDSYIPTTPITSFEGYLFLSEEDLRESSFWIVDDSGYTIRKQDGWNLIRHMIEGYFTDSNLMSFTKFEGNIASISKEESFAFYEMATVLSTSGTIATRKMLHKIVNEISNAEEDKLLTIWQEYNLVRLLLLKSYLSYSAENIGEVLTALKKLRTDEGRILLDLYNRI